MCGSHRYLLHLGQFAAPVSSFQAVALPLGAAVTEPLMEPLVDLPSEPSPAPWPAVVLLASLVAMAGLVGGCTVSGASECSSDDECQAGQHCLQGGGIMVRDGICVDRDAGVGSGGGDVLDATDGDVESNDNAGDDADAGGDADPGGDADAGGDAGPTGCDPDVVCDEYCYEKYTRCMAEECFFGATGSEFPDHEHTLCMEGWEDADAEPLIGCVDRASESEEACRQIEDAIDDYADQPCDGEDQRHRQCHELELLYTPVGEDVHEGCGCEAGAASAESCEEDEDCSESGAGRCLGSDPDTVCSAECNRYGDDPPAPLMPDATCAPDQGMCVLFDHDNWELSGPSGLSGMCARYCTGVADCPDGAGCMPVGVLEDEDGSPVGAIGVCSREVFWDLRPVCVGTQECPGTTTCREGACYQSCDGDDDCSGGFSCSGGFCDPEFVSPFE